MHDKELALKKITELVERFNQQLDSYKKSDYNETSTRRDFIDPFFKALGWDVDNENGYAESYREVIHEDKIKVGTSIKAPDYSFRLVGGKKLFFVEAKKPSIDVKDAIQPAYQLRRYGWNAKMPISIITDFEEFSVYDCSRKPHIADKASVSRIKYLTYKDYIREFDFIWDTFSKEQVLKGSFDKFLATDTHKKGTASVDRDFLQSLDNWRTYLATSISWNNKQLSEEEINYVVQQTIDRLIFLRIAEDRHIEPENNLKNTIRQGDYYKNLLTLFHEADDKYNSGLFDFNKDTISKNLIIENKILKTIISELYYPLSPYEFSVLSVEILGSAYEQFLGKVIRITPSHHAKIEEKPEVRKAGGVYYTPQYIVDYIVRSTIGKMIENRTPEEINDLKIIDPACGSGSFLLGAYQFLLDFHRDYYTQKYKSSKGSKNNPLRPDGNLTTNEKKRILCNNIYGVDLDINAVEVSKLSLLLKCMEGETEASINNQFRMFNERILPDLDNNIKSGNSLIYLDFYENAIDFGEERKVKPFNWEKAFPDVFKQRKFFSKEDFLSQYKKVKKLDDDTNDLLKKYTINESESVYGLQGGFDVVIGNPPYFSVSTLDTVQKEYYRKKYQVFENTTDIYCLFFEKAVNLLSPHGVACFITSNQWLQTNYGKVLRDYFVKNSNPEILINFGGFKVFQDATVDTSILLLSKNECRHHLNACQLKNDFNIETSLDDYFSSNRIVINNLNLNKWQIAETNVLGLKEKISLKGKYLKEWEIKIKYGVKTGLNEAFIISTDKRNELITQDPNSESIILPVLRGRDVHKHHVKWADLWLIVTRNGINIKDYPSINAHLNSFGQAIRKRADQGEKWWNLRACNYYELFEKEKIIYPETTVRRSEFFYDAKGFYIDKTCFMITGSHLKYLNGVLSSKLMEWYLESELRLLGKKSIQYSKQYIENVPVPPITDANQSSVEEIEKLVTLLHELHEEIEKASLQSQKETIQNKIEYCEKRINIIVYQLYDLSEEEKAIIELKSV